MFDGRRPARLLLEKLVRRAVAQSPGQLHDVRMRKRARVRDRTTEPARGRRAKASGEPPAATFPLVGSEVLDAIGSRGVSKRAMHDVIHAPDDGIAEYHLGPQQEASVSFRPDPAVGDAAADLAEELGQNSLRSATSGEDMSELEDRTDTDATEFGAPFVIEKPPLKFKAGRRRRRDRPPT